jgi:hypothetical protein
MTACGLAHIAPAKAENDFMFVVGNDFHKCPSFIANLLSPRIAQLQTLDPSADTYFVQTRDPDHQFDDFFALGRTGITDVTESNLWFLLSIVSELRNSELCASLLKALTTNETLSTFYERFGTSGVADGFADEAIEFLAHHFSELDPRFLDVLPISTLARILHHPSLKLVSEYSLYRFVRSQKDDPGSGAGCHSATFHEGQVPQYPWYAVMDCILENENGADSADNPAVSISGTNEVYSFNSFHRDISGLRASALGSKSELHPHPFGGTVDLPLIRSPDIQDSTVLWMGLSEITSRHPTHFP